MAVQSKFPLLKLPMLAYRNVIKTMEFPERITTSLCSDRLKKIVKSSLTQLRDATMQVYSYIIKLYTSEYFDGEFIISIEDIRNILNSRYLVYANEKTHSWNIPTLTINDWFKHLLEIMNCNSVSVQFEGSGLNVQDLFVLTQGLPIKKVEASSSLLYQPLWVHEALTTFYPAQNLQLDFNPFQDRQLLYNVISRDYDTIGLIKECETTIADILAMGSKSACIFNPKFSVLDLNLLIRAWFNGWTPSLKLLTVLFMRDGTPHTERVLNGFEYRKIEKERSFHLTEEINHTIQVGYDIVRKDGVLATIADDIKPAGTLITLIIWS